MPSLHAKIIQWAVRAHVRKVRTLMQQLNDAIAALEALSPQLTQAITDGKDAEMQAQALAARISKVTSDLQTALNPPVPGA